MIDSLSSLQDIAEVDISPSRLLSIYSTNLLWNLFLTSTALHAIALITSPLQAVYKWYRRQSSDSDTFLPYVCTIIPSALWLRYAFFIHDTKLIALQLYAVLMHTFFLCTLIYYKTKKVRTTRRLMRMMAGLLGGFIIFYYLVGSMGDEDGKMLTGRLASGAQMAGSLVCPYLIYRAISTRCIDFVPLAPVAFTWVMELHAIIYSVGIDDFYMLLANTTFFCMDGSLLAMFFIFPTEKKMSKPPTRVDIA
ncbi:hypothetical protein PFISCL1PPCAC_22630 [Pristionchus fissidentatus]|uniref:Sugar transporter SWEET n=1 Tax=Pristionchus fissidentatus TaxID=1538716 RepID=A0AAV5WM32_9BILA|nr:hypothetical protein PFISCL1PPCAC_22630 [Pristionchus fissidentatus]